MIHIISFTDRGEKLARILEDRLEGEAMRCGDPLTLGEWVKREFHTGNALVFVGAAGIAVRAVAPYVKRKDEDPAVVAVDEKGMFAVPILSGHLGGANDLAKKIAGILGGTPVILTATDVNGVFAVDEWAGTQDMAVLGIDRIKDVSAKILAGRTVTVRTFTDIKGETPENVTVIRENGSGEKADVYITIDPDMDCPEGGALVLIPRRVILGVGCKKGAKTSDIESLFGEVMKEGGFSRKAVAKVCSIDIKENEEGLNAFCEGLGVPLEVFCAEELQAVEGDFTPSGFVKQVTGTDNVCERSAVAGGGDLIVRKLAGNGVTMAAAMLPADLSWGKNGNREYEDKRNKGKKNGDKKKGVLYVVGIGPGGDKEMTYKADRALRDSEIICGYTTYTDLIRHRYPGKEFFSTPMKKEYERCRWAVDRALEGKTVAMVCSGDPGIYGMAGPLLSMTEGTGIRTEVIPGITASSGGAALLGAPLMNDYIAVSLSDQLTPWETIEKRIRAAGAGDLVTVFYNPASKMRPDHLKRACGILLEYRSSGTVCGWVRNIGRQGQEKKILTLGELADEKLDMLTTVIVGNSDTKCAGGYMVTERGYSLKAGNEIRPERDDIAAENEKVLIFGGTTEGRVIAGELTARGVSVTVSTATAEGASELTGISCGVITGRLDSCEMEDVIKDFGLVVDATHPYAVEVTKNIKTACEKAGKKYVRIVRKTSFEGPGIVFDDQDDAAGYLKDKNGNIMLTTGSSALSSYRGIDPLRLFPRVLPTREALEECGKTGIPVKNIIAMEGPFTEELNAALIKQFNIKFVVTKDGGPEGGFPEKAAAALAAGAELIVIGRKQEEGMTAEEFLNNAGGKR